MPSLERVRTVGILIAAFLLPSMARAAEPVERRWVYLQTNLQVKENVDKAGEILKRAAAAGYNGIVLADYKLNILDRVPEFYFDNAAQFRKQAEGLGIEIIPTVAAIGYSDGLLAHDPNLAEGIPVKDAAFVVRGGTARIDSALRNPLPGGSFEEHAGDRVSGWDFQDAAGEASFVDESVRHGGKASLRWDNSRRKTGSPQINARVMRRVPVVPWRQYHASVWIRTKGYEAASDVRLFAMTSGGRVLSHSNLDVKRDEDWTAHHVIFNSLENKEVNLYCGTWGLRGGTLWMDDLQLEETAFVNLVRREGCPLVVSDGAGKTFVEGKDFAALEDKKLGQVPWAGNFDVWHEPPTLTIPPGSSIKDGQKLVVGFSHTVTVNDNQVACCLAHPGVFRIVEDQVRRVRKLFEPRRYFLSHDEIRLANWCAACRRDGRTAGALLAENVTKCVDVIRSVDPRAGLCIWSDMFDPHHNAKNDYYLVNGDLAGSWQGLPKEMIVINWNSGQAAKSLPFFSERGHEQVLAGYYDGDPQRIRGWLDTGGGVSGVKGAMYTTWKNDFRQLEAFAKAAWGAK